MYQDPIIEKYIELLKASVPGITTWFQGEPTRIGASDLPAVMISKRETRVQPLTNAEDVHGVALTLTLVADIRKDLSTDEGNAAVVAGAATLYDLIEGRGEDYKLKESTVLHVLRHNLLVDPDHNLRTDLGATTRVDYGMTLSDRDSSEWRIEARVDFVCTYSQIR